jgi:oxygen-independent coproporphyrinogen-3 oxidase
MLGRIHTAAEARDAMGLARGAGFDNLSLDLIYGLPGQTLTEWQRTLDDTLPLGPEHLSLYALTLEEDAPMWTAIKEGSLPEIDPDLSADQYELAEDMLAAHGYNHYEISNWARPGRECRHNLTYWRNLPYLGAGVAAHSCLDGRRFANTTSLDEYIAGFSRKTSLLPELDEKINTELELAETVILGLRLGEGINADDIQSRFGIDLLVHYRRQVEEMADAGLLERTDGHIRLTRRGRLLSNEVFWRFLPE